MNLSIWQKKMMGQQYRFKIIKNPNHYLKGDQKNKIKDELDELINQSWGKFNEKYIEKSILNSYLLCLVFKDGKLVAAAPLKKITVFNSTAYSFGLTVVHPHHRGKDILNQMAFTLGRRIILENLFRFEFKVELFFITPNIRTLGKLSRVSSYIYPNPLKINTEGRVAEADDETWDRVREFLRVSREKYRSLEREGCVMEGFYDNQEHLIQSKLKHNENKLDKFGERYLYSGKGKEIVVRAVISVRKLLNG